MTSSTAVPIVQSCTGKCRRRHRRRAAASVVAGTDSVRLVPNGGAGETLIWLESRWPGLFTVPTLFRHPLVFPGRMPSHLVGNAVEMTHVYLRGLPSWLRGFWPALADPILGYPASDVHLTSAASCPGRAHDPVRPPDAFTCLAASRAVSSASALQHGSFLSSMGQVRPL